MSNRRSNSPKKPAVVIEKNKPASQPATADQCKACGLDYCDSEVCDCDVTVQVPPADKR